MAFIPSATVRTGTKPEKADYRRACQGAVAAMDDPWIQDYSTGPLPRVRWQ